MYIVYNFRMEKLIYSNKNSKLMELQKQTGRIVTGIGFPAGFTCRNAGICRTWVNNDNKLSHGSNARFSCYAAKVEVRYPATFRAHWKNYRIINDILLYNDNPTDEITNILFYDIGRKFQGIFRVGVSGDIWHPNLFMAFCNLAHRLPGAVLFGYTKILDYVLYNRPDNFHLVYSFGGADDKRLLSYPETPVCYVEETPGQYANIPMACNGGESDYDYIIRGQSFKLKLH